MKLPETVEVAPGLLVVLYPDTNTVEIASNYEMPDPPTDPRFDGYGHKGNVFMPLDLFLRVQAVVFPSLKKGPTE